MQNKTIHSYSLKHRLGEGGMAEVWYAENSIGKKAAVKILKEEFTKTEMILERFKNEAQVMVTLSHPHIRQVYDYGTIDARPCIVMEYLEGADLSDRLKRGERFSESQLGEWWDNMVDILHYTHQQGVIHRDIKPSNIFITKAGELKLLDFGIAKIKSSITLTQTGNRMGTLMYMSPEQVRDSKHLDYRSDVYSLAVTFYHLVNGKAPYDNHTDSEFDIQMKIVSEILDVSVLPTKWQNLLAPLLVKEVEKRGKLLKSGEVIASNGDKTRIIPKSQPKPEINSEPQPNSDGLLVTKEQPKEKTNQKGVWVALGAIAVIILSIVVWKGSLKKADAEPFSTHEPNIDNTEIESVLESSQEISVIDAKNVYIKMMESMQINDYSTIENVFAKDVIRYHHLENTSPQRIVKNTKEYLEKWTVKSFSINSFDALSGKSNKFRYNVDYKIINNDTGQLREYIISAVIGFIKEDGQLKINYIVEEDVQRVR